MKRRSREPLSAVIIAFNEASRIQSCLDSLEFCDEVLVLDSGSNDGTQSLCRRFGAKVVHQDWLGYGQQKRKAVELARHDWVLCLDADEQVTPELRASIEAAMQQPALAGFRMPRCNLFMGRWLRHGEGYPDYSLRLFDRRQLQWSTDEVHEKVDWVDASHGHERRVGKLKGDLLHESAESLEQYLLKQNRYTSLQADNLIARGKRISSSKLVGSPILRFLKFYLVRQGFRDGVPGLVHIAIGCFNSFIKYAKVRAEQARPKVEDVAQDDEFKI
ncbi:glycosyltransferase family 2 protein [Pokkaliibacter plantistimulans]|uniref:glycosyltransferase family 2 protein n=1 Tax=Pokkaliibacter plantistimulans TaxID=1635171 RepID=UPI00268950E0|nr:glycosyltransferase family 2 protein [Pokkaliibacter plantistimulans]